MLNQISTILNKKAVGEPLAQINLLQLNEPYVHGSCLIPHVTPSDIDIFIVSSMPISELQDLIETHLEIEPKFKNPFILQYELKDIDLTIYQNPGRVSDLRISNISNFDNKVCPIDPITGTINTDISLTKSGLPDTYVSIEKFQPGYYFGQINYKALFQFCSLSLQRTLPTGYGEKIIPYIFDASFPLNIKLPSKVISLFQEKFLHKFKIPKSIFYQLFSAIFASEDRSREALSITLDTPEPLNNVIKSFSMYRYLDHHHKEMGFQSLEDLIGFYKIIRPKKNLFADIKFLFKDTIPHVIELKNKFSQSLISACTPSFQKHHKEKFIERYAPLISAYFDTIIELGKFEKTDFQASLLSHYEEQRYHAILAQKTSLCDIKSEPKSKAPLFSSEAQCESADEGPLINAEVVGIAKKVNPTATAAVASKKPKKTKKKKAAKTELPHFLTWLNKPKISIDDIIDSLSTITAANLSQAKKRLDDDQFLTLETTLNMLPEHIIKKSLSWNMEELSLFENIEKIEILHAKLTKNMFQKEIIFHLLSNDVYFDQFEKIFHNIIHHHKELLEKGNTALLERTFTLFNDIYRQLVSSPNAIKHERSYFYLKCNIFLLGFDDALSELIKQKERFDTLTFNVHFDYPLLSHPLIIKQRKKIMELSPKNLPQTVLYFQNNTAAHIKEYLEITGHYSLSFKLIDLSDKINALSPSFAEDFHYFSHELGTINLGLKLFFDNSQSKTFIELSKEEIEPPSLFFKQLLYHTLNMTSAPTTNNEDIHDYFSAVVKEIKLENVVDQLTAMFVTQDSIKLKQFFSDLLNQLRLNPTDQRSIEDLTICHNFAKTLQKNYPEITLFELIFRITENILGEIDHIKEKYDTLKRVLNSLDSVVLTDKKLLSDLNPVVDCKHFETKLSAPNCSFDDITRIFTDTSVDLIVVLKHFSTLKMDHIFELLKRFAVYTRFNQKISSLLEHKKISHKLFFGKLSLVAEKGQKHSLAIVKEIEQLKQKYLSQGETLEYVHISLEICKTIYAEIEKREATFLDQRSYIVYYPLENKVTIFHTHPKAPNGLIEDILRFYSIELTTQYVQNMIELYDKLGQKILIINKDTYQKDSTKYQQILVEKIAKGVSTLIL